MVSNDLERTNGTSCTGHEHIIIHCWSLSEGVLIFSSVFLHKKKIINVKMQILKRKV